MGASSAISSACVVALTPAHGGMRAARSVVDLAEARTPNMRDIGSDDAFIVSRGYIPRSDDMDPAFHELENQPLWLARLPAIWSVYNK